MKDEYRLDGDYRAGWNLRDDAGREVASGVYFARLATNRDGIESVSSRKIVVID